jgi:hypothetical protein
MLQEQDSGFGIQAGKKPAGYIKLEIKGEKGVLTSFVQGLKYYHDGEYIYKAFIARTHDRPVFVDTGTIVIGNDGKGQKVWRFNASDIEGTGYSIDDFNVFGILVQKKGYPSQGPVCPLVGSTDRLAPGWKDVLTRQIQGSDLPGDRIEQEIGPKKEKRPVGFDVGQEAGRSSDADVQQVQGLDDRAVSDHPASENTGTDGQPAGGTAETAEQTPTEDSRPCREPADGQEPVKLWDLTDDLADAEGKADMLQDPDSRQPDDWQQGQYLQRYMEAMLEPYPRVEPFETPIEGSTWWRVNDYGYMFGTICDRQGNLKYYVYAVPGVYDEQFDRQMSLYGFSSWHPAQGTDKEWGLNGYWLSYVDAMTGTMANPDIE